MEIQNWFDEHKIWMGLLEIICVLCSLIVFALMYRQNTCVITWEFFSETLVP